MLNLTPYITLSQKQKTLYRFLQLALVTLFLLGMYFLIASIVLPEVKLSHQVRNTDPMFDLTAPRNSGDTITFSGSIIEDVDRVKVTMTFSEVINFQSMALSVQKGYRTFLNSSQSQLPFPQSTTPNTTPFPSGSLIRSSTEYFVVDRSTLQAVATSDALLGAGYSFESAIDSTSTERAAYSKGDRFDMRANHPSGTYYYDQNSDQHFRVADRSLHQVSPPTSDNTPIIRVDAASRQKSDNCTLKKSLFTDTYSCIITLQNTKSLPGKDYIFSLSGITLEPQSIQATFAMTPTTKNIQSRLGLIKQKLTQ